MSSRPLLVAGIAAGLLVVTLGVDASMTTTYALDVWTGSAWREIARTPMTHDGRSVVPFGQTTISANQSDDVRLRVRVDNGYAWATTHTFTALHAGETVADGTIHAPARAEASSEFAVPAQRFFDAGGSGREPVPRTDDPNPANVDLLVEIDGVQLYTNFNLREVSA